MQRLNLYVQSPTMTESYDMRRTSLDRSPPAAQRAPCSICRTYVQKNMWKLELIATEVEHPRVFIDTYSSAYWQLPLRMYRHIRRLYASSGTAIYWKGLYMF